MTSQLTAYITLICTSGVLNLYLCIHIFMKRHLYSNITKLFFLNILCSTIYCFGSAFALTASNLEEMKYWTLIQYLGMPFSPPLGLLFVMQCLGRKITKQRVIALLAIPFISVIMVATNDFHHLHYKEFAIHPTMGLPYSAIEIGFWYLVHGMFTFGSMFVAFILLISKWKETSKQYRPQVFALMVGQFVPMVTAFVYLVGLTPPGIDPVPMVIWITSLLYFWSISKTRLFAVMPIAKDAIFHSISDGVIVLDEAHQFIEFNAASKRMFPQLNKSMLGQNFEDMWRTVTGDSDPLQLESIGVTQELKLEEHIYQVRTAPLKHGSFNKGLLIIFTEITELKRLQSQLEQQAYFDELTQVYNRRAFFQQCEQKLKRVPETQEPLSIILLDIDYFKSVNDTYGHLMGDQILKHVAQVCQRVLGKDVLFARFGGEEFVLALDGFSAQEGKELADQIRREIESQPLAADDLVISVTASFGVAQATKEQEETLTQLLNRADKALYEAKENGRNCVYVYSARKHLIL